ncbi:MAG: glycerophosphoryl diester phosphodiesterase membrane domain-containing protein [Clostridia bacterium]|nr:glycerophosphoryl diester phosphodiesterase membrane domain-containing protein [Clostridia bacterium]
MMKKHIKNTSASGPISYGRLVFEAIPELFSFHLPISIMLGILAFIPKKLIDVVAESGGAALTTANLSDLLFSWRGLAVLLLGIILVAVFAVFEIFANIHLCDDILNGRKVSIFGEVGKGFRSLRHFLSPVGLLVLLYIFIAVPLCGMGFSITLTKDFHIPNFIMEVIYANPLYYVPYWMIIIALFILGLCGMFMLHGVLIDDMKPLEAYKSSFRILRKNWKNLVPVMLFTIIVLVLLNLVFVLFQSYLLSKLDIYGHQLPTGYNLSMERLTGGNLNETDYLIMAYRFVCAFVLMGGGYLIYISLMLSGSYVLLRFTRCYMEYTRESFVKWPSRSERQGYPMRILTLILTLVLLFLLSLGVGAFFNVVFEQDDNVNIVAHRTGGIMAPENSLEGIELAIEHGCYACETDTQRTKDGYYIINHDDDFKRLTGVGRKPGNMTLSEIRELVITDPVTGAKTTVPRLDEMLDVIKGRVKLFIELKGVSADRQMVDDVVKMVREKDCVSDVTLISLKYDVINYAETTYPEFETGVLMFGGIGDVSRINCDLLILEEEMATESRISTIHSHGKEVYVWTINTEEGMYKFLDSECDGIITDQIEMAESVQKALDNRSDIQLLKDKLNYSWD